MPHSAPSRSFDRIAVVVCDSVGCGHAPDAERFGDEGSNTLGHVVETVSPRLPNLRKLGLDRIPGVPSLGEENIDPAAAWGRMTERSAAKDTMTGHWELMGLIGEYAFPVYPDGFPVEVIAAFEAEIGRSTLGNYPASGTEIIRDLGEEHAATGSPIVYTSADSVFQIAAHEEVIPVEELYATCQVARDLLRGKHNVARVIARPFVGPGPDDYRRTAGRRDFALPPTGPTVLDHLVGAGMRTLGVGKIHDIFAGRGLTDWVKTTDNADGVAKTREALAAGSVDLVFTNLVEFDSLYGHRRDVEGYARALEEFDSELPGLLEALGANACLVLTADHGNDPTFRGTNHTRECVPLLVASERTQPVDLGTRASFADLGKTLLDNFGVEGDAAGTSFLDQIV